MPQALDYLKETASQTAGPYVHIGLTPNFIGIEGVYPADLGATMVNDKTRGERMTISGRVFDGSGTALKDALIEIWQADASGLYKSPTERRGLADPDFAGWGRCATDQTTGEFRFETVKPGRAPFKDGRLMAPHITFWIVARGINLGLQTRAYFADEMEANKEDPVLARIELRHRIETLLAQRCDGGYIFDIHLQGEKETIFFDI